MLPRLIFESLLECDSWYEWCTPGALICQLLKTSNQIIFLHSYFRQMNDIFPNIFPSLKFDYSGSSWFSVQALYVLTLPIWPVILFQEKDVLMKFKNASWMVIFKDNLIDNSILQRNLSQKVLYENMNLSKPICQ